jgi:hypothetical protein
VRNLGGDFIDISTRSVQTKLLCKGYELLFILNLITLRLPLRGHVQIMGNIATMVGVSGRSNRSITGDVSRHNAVGIQAAGTILRPLAERVDPAGTHVALLTAYTQVPEPAARFLFVGSVENGADVLAFRLLQHF